MEGYITRLRSIITFCMAITFLSNIFIKSNYINDLTLILLAILVALNFTHVTGINRIISYAFFVLSTILFIIYDAPLSIWKQALHENLFVIVLFTMTPLLSIPIEHGGYFNDLQGVFNRFVNTSYRFSLMVSLICAFVGIFVGMAILPLVNQISQASEISHNKKLLGTSMSRGFATSLFWAPTLVGVAMVLKFTGLSWLMFFPFGFFCSIVAGMIHFILIILEEKRKGNTDIVEAKKTFGNFNIKKVIELGIFSIGLIFCIAIVSIKTGITAIIIVSMAALIYPVIWMGIIGRLPVLYGKFKSDYFEKRLPKLKNEIILFVGAGLFTTSMTYSPIGNYISEVLSMLIGHNAFMLAVVILFAGLLLSAIGIHPVIILTIIGGTVKVAEYGVTPAYLAVILAICWSMGVIISPTSATVIAVSGLTEKSPIQAGLHWNGVYVLITSAVLIIMLTILRSLGLL